MQWKICFVGPHRSGKTRFVSEILGVDRREDFLFGGSTLGVNLDLVSFEGENLAIWDVGSRYLG